MIDLPIRAVKALFFLPIVVRLDKYNFLNERKEVSQIKKIIMIIIAVLLLGVSYYGMTNYMEAKAAVEDVPAFTAYTYEYNEYGYKPRTDIQISKKDLAAFLHLCKHKITILDSGDYMVEFDMENNQRWIVKISDPADKRWLLRTEPID